VGAKSTVIVSGASSIIGRPLIKLLLEQNIDVLAVSRKGQIDLPVKGVLTWDLSQPLTESSMNELSKTLDSKKMLSLIHCAPIWLLSGHIESVAKMNIKRVIAYSSTSVEGKAESADSKEQEIVSLLRDAEDKVQDQAKELGIDVTIFRPTMIYGYGQGQNIAFIAKLVQRFGMFPIVTSANGLRAPVHADDLAMAANTVLDEPKTFQKVYNLSGGEELTYKEMVQKIFDALNKQRRIISLPLFVYRFAIEFVSCVAGLLPK